MKGSMIWMELAVAEYQVAGAGDSSTVRLHRRTECPCRHQWALESLSIAAIKGSLGVGGCDSHSTVIIPSAAARHCWEAMASSTPDLDPFEVLYRPWLGHDTAVFAAPASSAILWPWGGNRPFLQPNLQVGDPLPVPQVANHSTLQQGFFQVLEPDVAHLGVAVGGWHQKCRELARTPPAWSKRRPPLDLLSKNPPGQALTPVSPRLFRGNSCTMLWGPDGST